LAENVATGWEEFRVVEIALIPYPARVAASALEDPTPNAIEPQVPAAVVFVEM
jgi:hypothetical protein